jgi:hypothetical protein
MSGTASARLRSCTPGVDFMKLFRHKFLDKKNLVKNKSVIVTLHGFKIH